MWPPISNERVGAQPLQQDLEFGAEEARVATLADHVVVGPQAEFGGDLGARVTFEQVDVLGTVELATEVDQVASMRLLEEHDRDATLAGLGDQRRCPVHAPRRSRA